MAFTYTRERDIRRAFWEEHPQFKRVRGRRQNEYPADVRMTWCDYVESLCRSGLISDRLAGSATL